jgi:hypothetical protein
MNRWMMFGLLVLCDCILLVGVFDLVFHYAGVCGISKTGSFLISLVSILGASTYLRARARLSFKAQR